LSRGYCRKPVLNRPEHPTGQDNRKHLLSLFALFKNAMTSIYDQHLPRNAANHAALSPLGFIERTAEVYP
jgi:hypothetical protein